MKWHEEELPLTEEQVLFGVRPASAQKETAQRLAPFQSNVSEDARMELDRFERDQLMSITGSYGEGGPYWWGKKSMLKMEAKGLVERHPKYPGAYRALLPAFELAAKLEPNEFRSKMLESARKRLSVEPTP